MIKTKFKGSIPAVITPFNDNEDISRFKTLMKLYDQADIINDIA